MSDDTALAKTETRIAPLFGERAEVREMVDRIKAGLANAQNATAAGIMALATASIAHGLDPWNGEIWLCRNERTGEEWVQAGIKGRRKKAKEQLPDRDRYYINFAPITPEMPEWKQWGLDKPNHNSQAAALVQKCTLRRSDHVARYTELLDQLHKVTGSYEEAAKLAGPAPVFEGIGIVWEGEKSRMNKINLCKKRAEDDALKQAFDLPFSGEGRAQQPTAVVGLLEADDEDGSPPAGAVVEGVVIEKPTPKAVESSCAQCGCLLLDAAEQGQGLCANCRPVPAAPSGNGQPPQAGGPSPAPADPAVKQPAFKAPPTKRFDELTEAQIKDFQVTGAKATLLSVDDFRLLYHAALPCEHLKECPIKVADGWAKIMAYLPGWATERAKATVSAARVPTQEQVIPIRDRSAPLRQWEPGARRGVAHLIAYGEDA